MTEAAKCGDVEVEDTEIEDSLRGRGTGLLPLLRSLSSLGVTGPGLGAAASRGFGSGSKKEE